MNRNFIYFVLSGVTFCFSGIKTDEKTVDNSQEKIELYPGTDIVVTHPKPFEVDRRSFIDVRYRRWPRAIVPYEVGGGFDRWSKLKLQKAIKLFHQVSCVRFVPHRGEINYVRFTSPNKYRCASPVGRTGGLQRIYLSHGCFHVDVLQGSVVHEMMHTLGFIHEQMRDDRDCYILITGIGKTMQDLAMLFGTDTTFIYDFNSIMHYKNREYISGRHGERLGNLKGTLTEWDKLKLNYMYCNGPHYCHLYPRQCSRDNYLERFCQAHAGDESPYA